MHPTALLSAYYTPLTMMLGNIPSHLAHRSPFVEVSPKRQKRSTVKLSSESKPSAPVSQSEQVTSTECIILLKRALQLCETSKRKLDRTVQQLKEEQERSRQLELQNKALSQGVSKSSFTMGRSTVGPPRRSRWDLNVPLSRKRTRASRWDM